jgi:5-amino-6-(5-phospho-D-ribitylamino)uracil phosphatase
MDFKLIAVDVDGTLLRSDGNISDRTRQSLREAVDRGASLVVATGRRRRTALPIVERLALPHLLASSQGAVVWQQEDVLSHSHLPRASARIALDVIRESGMACVIFGNALREEVLWVAGDWRANERLAKYLQTGTSGSNSRLMREFSDEAFDHDPIQFIVFDTIERLEALNEALTGHAPPPPSPEPPAQPGPEASHPLWRVIFSRNQFTAGGAIEIVGPNTSKASALAFLCNHLGVTREQVVAFGDNINDVEMLEFAGLGIAMANGTDEAFHAADRIGPSNDEDGIAQVLEELGLAKVPG